MSAPEAQEIASMALCDQEALCRAAGVSPFSISPSLRRLAGIGSSGTHPGNAHRDLVAWLGEPSIPGPYVADVPVKVQKPIRGQAKDQSCPCHFLLPHVYFADTFANRSQIFEETMLGGDASNPPKFWAGVVERRDPRLAHHPLMRKPDWMRKCIPLSWHGDAVPCIGVGKATSRSLDVWSWQSVLALRGKSTDVKNIATSIFSASKGSGTEEAMGKILLWSFQALGDGVWPEKDHNGKAFSEVAPGSMHAKQAGLPLADGFFGVVWLIKGDLDYLANSLHLRHYSARMPCELCPCDNGLDQRHWASNFGPSSVWANSSYSRAQWSALRAEVPHWLFRLPHVSNLNIEPDELHLLHLGASMWALGSVLWLIVFRIMDRSVSENVDHLWCRIRASYDKLKPDAQYSNFSLSSFCDPTRPRAHYPKLKGRGAEVKCLVGVMAVVWEDLRDPAEPDHSLISAMLCHLVGIHSVIDEFAQSFFLTREASGKLTQRVADFLSVYTQLAHNADGRGDLLWNLTIKFHWLWHFGQRCHYLSPRRGACLIDEDFVGKVKKVAAACAAGTKLHFIPAKVLDKMRWGRHFANSAF